MNVDTTYSPPVADMTDLRTGFRGSNGDSHRGECACRGAPSSPLHGIFQSARLDFCATLSRGGLSQALYGSEIARITSKIAMFSRQRTRARILTVTRPRA